ncbi:hypothetical protein [Bosea sp. BIWAKO-01]|uniref:hypothetical protein n=1 Tax=Bosea sp. BIWAKO-01 TaxID=506668 RepID=UPI00114D3536|nr:hypothetical protein [Bosea sp. BIWAKO-01]
MQFSEKLSQSQQVESSGQKRDPVGCSNRERRIAACGLLRNGSRWAHPGENCGGDPIDRQIPAWGIDAADPDHREPPRADQARDQINMVHVVQAALQADLEVALKRADLLPTIPKARPQNGSWRLEADEQVRLRQAVERASDEVALKYTAEQNERGHRLDHALIEDRDRIRGMRRSPFATEQRRVPMQANAPEPILRWQDPEEIRDAVGRTSGVEQSGAGEAFEDNAPQRVSPHTDPGGTT